MPLPSSGPLSLSQVNVELGKASTAPVSLNDADVRTLAGKPSGAISFADLLGKSAEVFEQFTLTAGYRPYRFSGTDKSNSYAPEERGFNLYAVEANFGFSAYGMISPSALRGYRVVNLGEEHGDAGYFIGRVDRLVLRIDGFASDPGAAFVKRVDIYLGASLLLSLNSTAATYKFYGTGSTVSSFPVGAFWAWQLPQVWHLGQSGTYTVRIYYPN